MTWSTREYLLPQLLYNFQFKRKYNEPLDHTSHTSLILHNTPKYGNIKSNPFCQIQEEFIFFICIIGSILNNSFNKIH